MSCGVPPRYCIQADSLTFSTFNSFSSWHVLHKLSKSRSIFVISRSVLARQCPPSPASKRLMIQQTLRPVIEALIPGKVAAHDYQSIWAKGTSTLISLCGPLSARKRVQSIWILYCRTQPEPCPKWTTSFQTSTNYCDRIYRPHIAISIPKIGQSMMFLYTRFQFLHISYTVAYRKRLGNRLANEYCAMAPCTG